MSKKNIVLPRIYTEEVWARHKNPEHKKFIGKHYVSWSQVESFRDKKGFNTGFLGELEFILNYFSDVTFPDMGWGDFGSETEAYITVRDSDRKTLDDSDRKAIENAEKNFSEEEKAILRKIKPLGVFQEEICFYLEDLDVIVLGYIDDRSFAEKDLVKMLRDYKTKSESSKKDLHDPKKMQIELYILGLRQTGLEVEEAEYCIIERGGGRECMQGGGRGSLFVKDRIWYENYTWDEDRLKEVEETIKKTVINISNLYKTYLKFFG